MIIAITNQKGGVGKSTTALALAAGLLSKKRRVLVVDLDAQGNTSTTARAETNEQTIFSVMAGETATRDAIQDVQGLHIIPAARKMAIADKIFSDIGDERLLKEALSPIAKGYDVILIDTPPALGILTANALTASDGIIIPACAEAYGLQGITQLRKTMENLQKLRNKKLHVMGILITRYRETVLKKSMVEMAKTIAADMGATVYKTKIREAIAINEAQAKRCNIFDYAPNSNGAQDYAAFVGEVLAQIGKGRGDNGKRKK